MTPPAQPTASGRARAPGLTGWLCAVLGLAALAFLPKPLSSQSCFNCGVFLPLRVCPIDETITTQEPACNGIINCVQPKMTGPFVEAVDQGNGSFAIRFTVDVRTPFNRHPDAFSNGKLDIAWWQGTPSGFGDLCENNSTDRTKNFLQLGTASCASVPVNKGTYSVRANICGGPGTSCGHWDETIGAVAWVTAQTLGCLPPREWGCPEDPRSCNPPCLGPGGSSSPGGGGPGASPPNSGPGARLRYSAGGTGSVGTPGATGWRASWGQGWSHDYAVAIVADPDRFHVWLLTEFGTFREFTDIDEDGAYETVSPESETRDLTWTGTGWELQELTGEVHAFNGSGRWVSTTLPEGTPYAKVAEYDAGTGKLSRVTFPDGRREDFSYGADGKLAAITEVGVDGATSRTWEYRFAGEDLVRIDLPDGTAWELSYGDTRYPGYMTRMELVADVPELQEGQPENRRVEAAWEYDDHGNVAKTWKGDASFSGAGAVDTWSFSYDDPVLPTLTTVTDPLGDVTTYSFDGGRASVHSRPKLTNVSGDCPLCDLAGTSQLAYGDADNPFSPTQVTDGRLTTTVMSYNGNGQMTSRTEAFGLSEARMTEWKYEGPFPALVTRIEVPSVIGGASLRTTEIDYDPVGNPTHRRIAGVEAGSAFLYETVTTYNAAGEPTEVDPPGYEAAPTDQTTWSYTPDGPLEPDRNGLLPFARNDPIVGTTRFGYDAFNRRLSVTDPNAVETTTGYDPLDRVTEVRSAANTAAEVVTTHEYDPFGQLFRTTLPRGNVLEYGYDGAGRLVTVERKPGAATPGERTRYVLDGAGNRTEEQLERWDAVAEAWETVSTTTFAYESRCRVTSITQGDGSPTPSTMHFSHDCNGNLEHQWDANHPRFDPGTGAELPPTRTFGYDPLDRLTSVSEPWGGARGGDAVTEYSYDVQDHLISVEDAEENLTEYEVSDRDLLTQEDSPVSGATTHAYNEHGELTETTDARGVTVSRSVDAADRVTSVDYPDDALDTDFGYDAAPAACGGTSFPVGRLGSITRDGQAVEYCYDALGRRTRDGELALSYDANGNRTGIGYPGNVSAAYTFDFADREASLTVTTPSTLDQTVASGATYLPSGPLAAVTLGNGLAETRGFDERYHPAGIALTTTPPGHSWTYTTDAVGNVLGVTEIRPCGGSPLVLTDQTVDTTETFESCASIEAGPGFAIVDPGNVTLRATERVVLRNGFSVGSGAALTVSIEPVEGTEEIERTYAYQGVQYFLTGADGPWGALDWTHDRIGNRLTETRDGGNPDTYQYLTNGGGGNTPILDLVNLGIGGTRDYTYGLAGHLEEVVAGANVIDFGADAEGRLSAAARSAADVSAAVSYDGRSFLTQAVETTGDPPTEAASVEAVYDSQGLLHALRRQASPADPEELVVHFYLAGRPVAQVSLLDGAETWSFLTTDHLGTPLVATASDGEVLWQGGFEPFGEDYQQGTQDGALGNGLYLRLPGQWEDTSWQNASSGAGVYYNVHRWYLPGLGRYTRPDPFGLRYVINVLAYTSANPVMQSDPDGRSPTLPAHNPITCSVAVATEARSRGKGLGWRWAHCWASCQITKSCGGEAVAKPFGLLKEVIDLVGCFASSINSIGTGGPCESAFQPTDFQDNEFGRTCPLPVSCEERCKDLAGRSSPPGPFFGLSIPVLP